MKVPGEFENELNLILKDAESCGTLTLLDKKKFEHVNFPEHIEKFLSNVGVPLDAVIIGNSFCAQLSNIFAPFEFKGNSLWHIGDNPAGNIYCTSQGEVISIEYSARVCWGCGLDTLIKAGILYRRIWEYLRAMVETDNFGSIEYTRYMSEMLSYIVKAYGNPFDCNSPALVQFKSELDDGMQSTLSLVKSKASKDKFSWPSWMGDAIVVDGEFEGYYRRRIEHD